MRCGRTLARRTLLRRAAVTAAALYASSWPVQAASKTVVGFIYVGPRDDFGYNQAHAQGAAAVAKLAGGTVVEEEAVLAPVVACCSGVWVYQMRPCWCCRVFCL